MDIMRQSTGLVRKCLARTRRSAFSESRASDHSALGLILYQSSYKNIFILHPVNLKVCRFLLVKDKYPEFIMLFCI